MVPLAGLEGDAEVLRLAGALAEPFDAELAVVHAPADIADLMPWMGEGFMGGVQVSAVDSLKDAAAQGAESVREVVAACGYARISVVSLQTPVWAGLAMESRLSDVVVFDQRAASGRGPLAEAFQQVVADEQRPVVVARPGVAVGGVVAVAWDGGKEATRAARKALPLLARASRTIILGAPGASSRRFDLARLRQYLAERGVEAEVREIAGEGDAGRLLLDAARDAGATTLVAGAFGHTRLREYIFGGATRTLLNSEGPSLFLSH